MVATYEWAALGTYAQLAVDDESALPAARDLARRQVARIDETCSRFRASDLVLANVQAGSWVRVDPLLVRAVDAALGAARSTDGLVDPTLGRQLVELGYDADFAAVRSRGTAAAAASPSTATSTSTATLELPRTGRWLEVETDARGWLRVPAGTSLDLGATGKAFAADLVADLIASQLGCATVVSLGGDVAVGGPRRGDGWPVLVSDTHGADLSAPGQVVLVAAGGVATSSTRHRRWSRGGVPTHHIVDPRTGLPTDESVVSATVCGTSCVAANAASTAAIVLGREAGAWLTARALPAYLIDGEGRTFEYAGWPGHRADGIPC